MFLRAWNPFDEEFQNAIKDEHRIWCKCVEEVLIDTFPVIPAPARTKYGLRGQVQKIEEAPLTKQVHPLMHTVKNHITRLRHSVIAKWRKITSMCNRWFNNKEGRYPEQGEADSFWQEADADLRRQAKQEWSYIVEHAKDKDVSDILETDPNMQDVHQYVKEVINANNKDKQASRKEDKDQLKQSISKGGKAFYNSIKGKNAGRVASGINTDQGPTTDLSKIHRLF